MTAGQPRLVGRMYKSLTNVQCNERMTACTCLAYVNSQYLTLFRTVIPEILNDGQRLLQLWERAGSLDPFEKIHEVSQLLSPSLPFTGVSACHSWYRGVDTLHISANLPSHCSVSDVHRDS
jgi:hypothetical protein